MVTVGADVVSGVPPGDELQAVASRATTRQAAMRRTVIQLIVTRVCRLQPSVSWACVVGRPGLEPGTLGLKAGSTWSFAISMDLQASQAAGLSREDRRHDCPQEIASDGSSDSMLGQCWVSRCAAPRPARARAGTSIRATRS